MKAPDPRLLCAILLGSSGWLGCSTAPQPAVVPVIGATDDLSILIGDWWGEYTSVDTGRDGRIRFSLDAESGQAFGDVVMFPGGDGEPGRGPEPRPLGGRTLTIRFVRPHPASETVTGTLEPYEDPDCRCIVTTTFTGRASRDRIEGTFETRGGPEYRRKTGRWRVDRRQPGDESRD